MNSVLITLVLLLCVAAVSEAGKKATLEEVLEKHQSADGCVCMSPSFGCQNIKGPTKMVQAGWCKKRCCKERVAGEKKQCKCMNKTTCPKDMPVEDGECLKLMECCPEQSKVEL